MAGKSSEVLKEVLRPRREDLPQNITMSVADWIEIPDNPRQRDTERHARRAKHLLTPAPTHRRVSMAMTPDGNRKWKLDGHTRALLWRRNEVQRPPDLNVSIFLVTSQIEAEELYVQFDAAEAVETGSDKVFGAYQALGYRPESKYLMMAGINTAVRVAQGLAEGMRRASKESIYRLIGDWLQEIQRIDQINPDHRRFNSALLAAALVAFRKHPDDDRVFDFLTRYNDDAGEKIGDMRDAVEALSHFMLEARGEMGKKRNVDASRYAVIGKALAAVEAFRRNATYTRGFAGIDPTKYLTER